MIRRCLRKRGWVELNYHKNKGSSKARAKRAVPKRGHSAKVKGERAKESEEGDDDDADSDVDLDLGLSDDENDDEEEYSLVVS